MKPLETILQSQRKMFDFDNNPMLGEIDYVDAYRNAETFDEYMSNVKRQHSLSGMTTEDRETAETMWDELNSKYSDQ